MFRFGVRRPVKLNYSKHGDLAVKFLSVLTIECDEISFDLTAITLAVMLCCKLRPMHVWLATCDRLGFVTIS